MAIIAVYSVKGGVGKTTMAATLAWCSAAISRRKTLLWDLDAQGGAGFLYGLDAPQAGRADSVFDSSGKPAKLIRSTATKRLDVLPADASLRTLDRQFAALGKKRRLARVAARLDRDYERIILDCPPVLNEVSAQVIRAADVIVLPLPPSPLSARALDMIREEIADNHRRHPPILPVLSMVDARRSLHRDLIASQPAWPIVPMASAVEQMAVRQLPLGKIAPRSPAMQAFRRLWTAIERKLAQV